MPRTHSLSCPLSVYLPDTVARETLTLPSENGHGSGGEKGPLYGRELRPLRMLQEG